MSLAEPPSDVPQPQWDESVRHHIDLIQMTIIRMSAASSSAKGWVLPVVTATYGYALTQQADSIAALGASAAILFWILDARYLREERAYRKLFAAVTNGDGIRYDMDASRYYRRSTAPTPDYRERSCQLWRVVLSWSAAGFYGPIVATGIVAAVLTH